MINSSYIYHNQETIHIIETTTEYKTSCLKNQLLIEHQQYSHSILYDICDMDGKIYLSGELEKLNDSTKVKLDKIPFGGYQLFIINEGMVFKKNFKHIN